METPTDSPTRTVRCCWDNSPQTACSAATCRLQVFQEGDNSNFLLLDLPLGVGVGCAPADSTLCDYETCFGCTDPLACNYDAGADFDDGSCAIPGPCDICLDGVPVTVFDNDGDGICDEEEILVHYEEALQLRPGGRPGRRLLSRPRVHLPVGVQP